MKTIKLLALSLLLAAASNIVAMNNKQKHVAGSEKPLITKPADPVEALRQHFIFDEPAMVDGKYTCDQCKPKDKFITKCELKFLKHIIYTHTTSAIAEHVMKQHPEIFPEESSNEKPKTDEEFEAELDHMLVERNAGLAATIKQRIADHDHSNEQKNQSNLLEKVSKKRTLAFPCTHCKDAFEDACTLADHQQAAHPMNYNVRIPAYIIAQQKAQKDLPDLPCQFCSRSFKAKGFLDFHISKDHKRCTVCFEQVEDSYVHTKEKHPETIQPIKYEKYSADSSDDDK